MNPLDELSRLTDLFPSAKQLFTRIEHIPASTTPEPYRRLLVHDHHMTVAMEEFYHSPVEVRVLSQRIDGEVYSRKIILIKSGTNQVVQFGIVRFDLRYITAPVRAEILRGDVPLGRILINHNVLRHIDLGAILQIEPGPELCDLFHVSGCPTIYGRLATIFCNRKPAVDLLEIAAPCP